VHEELECQDHELRVPVQSCHELVGVRAGALRRLAGGVLAKTVDIAHARRGLGLVDSKE
jgi:hypothetical protein